MRKLVTKRTAFIDRGDFVGVDFDETDLTTDWSWHELDLNSIVPSGTKAVLIKIGLKATVGGAKIFFRKSGLQEEINVLALRSLHADSYFHRNGIVAVSSGGCIQYKAENITWIGIDISIRGFFV